MGLRSEVGCAPAPLVVLEALDTLRRCACGSCVGGIVVKQLLHGFFQEGGGGGGASFGKAFRSCLRAQASLAGSAGGARRHPATLTAPRARHKKRIAQICLM